MATPNPALERLVRELGVRHVLAELEAHDQPVTRMAVTHWLRGRARPRPPKARVLVEISDGKLTLEDLYSPPGSQYPAAHGCSGKNSTPRLVQPKRR